MSYCNVEYTNYGSSSLQDSTFQDYSRSSYCHEGSPADFGACYLQYRDPNPDFGTENSMDRYDDSSNNSSSYNAQSDIDLELMGKPSP